MDTKRPQHTHTSKRDRKPALGAAVGAAVMAAAVFCRLRRVEVEGRSMWPAFEPGDRLVVIGPWPPKPGQVIALADPRLEKDARLMIKRVHRVGPAGIEVRGDNAAASTDSRAFGPVHRSALRGRVVYRYHPPQRVGWWPG